MSTLHNTYKNFFPAGSGAATVHTTPGLLLAILASTAAASDTITLYDSSTTSGDVLLTMHLRPDAPVRLFTPENMPFTFWKGLTVDPSASHVFLFTRA